MRICEQQMVEWGDSERRKGTEGGRARPMYPCCSAGHTMPSTRLGPKALLLPWAQPDPFPMTLGADLGLLPDKEQRRWKLRPRFVLCL